MKDPRLRPRVKSYCTVCASVRAQLSSSCTHVASQARKYLGTSVHRACCYHSLTLVRRNNSDGVDSSDLHTALSFNGLLEAEAMQRPQSSGLRYRVCRSGNMEARQGSSAG
jgi:hypothetical protein